MSLRADPLIDHISATWIKVGKGQEGGPVASSLAKKGYFVVALLKAKDHLPFKRNTKTGKFGIPHPYHHGHLAIVLGTPTAGYPYVICGSINPEGRSDGHKKVYEKGANSPWKEPNAPKVEYYRTLEIILDPAK